MEKLLSRCQAISASIQSHLSSIPRVSVRARYFVQRVVCNVCGVVCDVCGVVCDVCGM